jgi:hypothetical protein
LAGYEKSGYDLLADGEEKMQRLIPVFLRIIGVILIIVGMVAAYYGPLEIFVFYFFSEGGQFHYDGFGVGSFWFAALVVQNIGYYIIAALCLPVGIGHVKVRRWVLPITQLYIWFWLGAGLLLIGNGILLISSMFEFDISRDTLFLRLSIMGVLSFIFLILLPVLALRFYKNGKVKAVFEAHDSNRYWTERYPFPLLALLLLFVIMIIVQHVAIFFQGLFPMFGQILLGRPSAYLNALCILILGILIYGMVQLKKWAWWGSVVFITLLTISSVMTFSRHGFYDIILMMNLPVYEMGFIDKMIVFHEYRLVGLVVVPLLVALGLVTYSKRYFLKDGNLDRTKAS